MHNVAGDDSDLLGKTGRCDGQRGHNQNSSQHMQYPCRIRPRPKIKLVCPNKSIGMVGRQGSGLSKLPHFGTASWGMMRMRAVMFSTETELASSALLARCR